MLSSRSSETTDVELHLLSGTSPEPDSNEQSDLEAQNLGLTASAAATAHEGSPSTTLYQRPKRFSNTTPEPSSDGHRASHVENAAPQSPHSSVDSPVQWWTPGILRRRSLYTFVVFYICSMVTLVVLSIVDRNNAGIATVQSEWHYAWTYGPTLGIFCRPLTPDLSH